MKRIPWYRLDWVVVSLTAMLCGLGLLFIWSVTHGHPALEGSLKSHGIRLVMSLPFLLLPLLITPRAWRRRAGPLYGTMILLLLAVRVIGVTRNQARRWIDIGGVFLLQPSEFMKPVLVLALARLLSSVQRARRSDHVMYAVLLTVVPAGLIVIQPDLGTALVLFPVTLTMLIAAGARRRHLVTLVLLAIAAMPVVYFTAAPYQRERITSWWNQDHLTTSQQRDSGYHLWNSKIAVGTGGVFGKGVGEGPHNRLDYLPFRHTDFVFSVIAEELGFLGASLVLLLYLGLVQRIYHLALSVREGFSRLAGVGMGTILLVHLVINVGVTIGMVPTTGLPLPLISFGGSSIMATFFSLGVALSVVMHRPRTFSEEARQEAGGTFDRRTLQTMRSRVR